MHLRGLSVITKQRVIILYKEFPKYFENLSKYVSYKELLLPLALKTYL